MAKKELEKWCMEFHQHVRARRAMRQALPVQQLPDEVMHQHGLRTNNELIAEALGPYPDFPVTGDENE